MTDKVWLIGSGPMALEYSKVLKALKKNCEVIGRGKRSADFFYNQTKIKPHLGGLDSFLLKSPIMPNFAIVSAPINSLSEITLDLLDYGVKNILVEKPGALAVKEAMEINNKAEVMKANVFIAYNRRFYQSTLMAKKIISEEDLLSFKFDFTEWSHDIENLKLDKSILNRWFLANSSHLVDLAFYLCGKPNKIESISDGNLPWHPSSSIFCGHGVSEKGALFSYHANWSGPGRWDLEIQTRSKKLIFKPLEKLQFQRINSVNIEEYEGIDYSIDNKYKPGLFCQTEAFLESNFSNFLTFKEQIKLLTYYKKMANY